jgi:hypothetical protein
MEYVVACDQASWERDAEYVRAMGVWALLSSAVGERWEAEVCLRLLGKALRYYRAGACPSVLGEAARLAASLRVEELGFLVGKV